MMKRVVKEVVLNTDPMDLWAILTDKKSYEKWTTVFSPNSTYEGIMALNEELLFTDGSGSGMAAKVKVFEPGKHIAFGFVGEVVDGKLEAYKTENSGIEEYILEDLNGKTKLTVHVDILDEYYQMMDEMWDNAIVKFKELTA